MNSTDHSQCHYNTWDIFFLGVSFGPSLLLVSINYQLLKECAHLWLPGQLQVQEILTWNHVCTFTRPDKITTALQYYTSTHILYIPPRYKTKTIRLSRGQSPTAFYSDQAVSIRRHYWNNLLLGQRCDSSLIIPLSLRLQGDILLEIFGSRVLWPRPSLGIPTSPRSY